MERSSPVHMLKLFTQDWVNTISRRIHVGLHLAGFLRVAPHGGKKLFTPGPLCTSKTVKEAMLLDYGSRDTTFIETVKYIREKLLDVAGVDPSQYTCVPLQGSGTYALEAVISSTVPRQGGKVLVLANGAYGMRVSRICKAHNIDHVLCRFPDEEKVRVEVVEEALKQDTFTNVSIVHCETSSGVINPVEDVGLLLKRYTDATYFVDAMSSFGAIPLDMVACGVDYLVSSANKCIEGIPGFSYVIANREKLFNSKGWSRTLSFDLVEQCEGLDQNGQFRFTPPTHVMLAFKQALIELEQEGGVKGRARRYKENRSVLRDGMTKLGFRELLDDSHRGYIITSYHFPNDPNFDFKTFYTRLGDLDQVIYPGKMTEVDCFRIGNIGHLFPADMRKLLDCIEHVCNEMRLKIPIVG
ncbi:PREDICTED: 2-aminoethylphosphonate--pyruvate transaminase-like isoform X2 [Priapulus caudatus]|uniref:Alanine--glyoxylate aminotransferase n=1 Tax=Priapulus caudatus TaxID=37621 RepID=A0ABM1E5M9_PRICU|nr:PREDICTED: 2-aminoethylphosphonate--pyruvate transaminase-like isoform X2 [Priapulus caudatus]